MQFTFTSSQRQCHDPIGPIIFEDPAIITTTDNDDDDDDDDDDGSALNSESRSTMNYLHKYSSAEKTLDSTQHSSGHSTRSEGVYDSRSRSTMRLFGLKANGSKKEQQKHTESLDGSSNHSLPSTVNGTRGKLNKIRMALGTVLSLKSKNPFACKNKHMEKKPSNELRLDRMVHPTLNRSYSHRKANESNTQPLQPVPVTSPRTSGSPASPRKSLVRSSSFNKIRQKDLRSSISETSKNEFLSDDESVHPGSSRRSTRSVRQQQRPKRKRVRFNFRRNEEFPSNIELTNKDIEMAWWTEDDQDDTMRRVEIIAEVFRSSKPEISNLYSKLLSQCTLSTDTNITSFIERFDGKGVIKPGFKRVCDASVDLTERDHFANYRRLWSEGAVRGLEELTVPMLVFRRTACVGLLVKTQRLQRSLEDDGEVTSDHVNRILAIQYQRSSQYASYWARLMAIGDALAVHSEDFEFCQKV